MFKCKLSKVGCGGRKIELIVYCILIFFSDISDLFLINEGDYLLRVLIVSQ